MRKQIISIFGFLFMGLTAVAFPVRLAVAATAPTPLNVSQIPSIYAQKGIAPNLIFMLDDSGSMQWEYLGNQGYLDYFTYGFPLGNSQPYGNQTYQDTIPGFGPKNIYGAQFRNSFVNPNYYNPSVTYTPWACPVSYPENAVNAPGYSPQVGGSCQWDAAVSEWLWPKADPGKTYLSPYVTSAGFRSLNVWNDSFDSNNSTTKNGYIGDFNGTNGLQWRIKFRGNYYWWNYPYPAEFDSDSNPVAYGFWPATYFTYHGPRSGPSQKTAVKGIGYYTRIQICPQATLKVAASNGNGGTKKITACNQPAALPTTIGNNNYNHTYIATSGSYTDLQGQPLSCKTGANACYVHVKNNGSLIVRSYTQELQNFANWYQYYRSHILLARAGTSQAFMGLPNGFRVDYSLLNHMAKSGSTPQYSVTSAFTNTQRSDFLQRLFQTPIPAQGTPSRYALAGIGNWLSRSPGASPPWGTSVAEKQATGKNYLSCRQNYLVFVTDGGWNGGGPTVGNADGEKGPKVTGPGNTSYQYSPSPPFKDSHSNTFADVAFHYWEQDLQKGMSNNVPTNSVDAGFWQHLVTFDVGLGIVPSLVTNYQLKHPGVTTQQAQAIVYTQLQSGSTSWPSGSSNKIDDLWHGGVDGHGAFLSASSPTAFASALKNTLLNIVNRTASSSSLAVNTEKAGQVQTRLQVFQALFHPQNWWGDVLALPVMATPATTTSPANLSVGTNANWSASCVLTGGPCSQMGTSGGGVPLHSVPVESPSNRTILSWNGAAPVAFTANTLSPAAVSLIGGAAVVNYLRGDRSQESSQGGSLRTRKSVMGDVVDSSPTFVGAPAANFSDIWSNVLYPKRSGLNPENASGAVRYSTFKSNNANRENIVYVGGNDGMLHAFRAGTTTNSTTNDGHEVLAYVPKAVYPHLRQYSWTTYQHHYYVNATPGAGDVFYGGSWHTWLVGGEGAGGNSIYALDITHPAKFSQSNLSTVVGEWGPGNITCVNVANCGQDLGDTFGTPVITRFNNGQWGFVFGNGFNSATGVASIFVGLIGNAGKVTFYELKTGYGSGDDPTGANRPDGIAYATPVDLNGDRTADYVYAGDYFGNVWRFNLTSYLPTDWQVGYAGAPMFKATNSSGAPQPITTKLLVVAVPAANGYSRVMVEFGTGATVTDAQQAPNITNAGVQSLYGIWDWNFSAWNSGRPTASIQASTPVAFHYASLSSGPGGGSLGLSNLTQQTIIAEQTTGTVQGGTNDNRVVSNNAVCFKGNPATTKCKLSQNARYGWYLNLVSPIKGQQGEKVIYDPVLHAGVLIAITTIPSSASGVTCQSSGAGGWTMAIDPATGGRLSFEVFDTKGNGQFDQVTVNGTLTNTAGIALGAVGSPSFVTYDNTTFMVTNPSGGTPTLSRTNLGTGRLGVQLSWQELR